MSSSLAATSVTMAMTIVASIHVQIAVKTKRSTTAVTGSAWYQCAASQTEERPQMTLNNA